MNIRKLIVIGTLYVASVCGLLWMAGCAEALDAPTKSTIHQIDQTSAIDAEKVKAKARVSDARGANSPLAHPIASAGVTVKRGRDSLGVIALLSFLVFAISLGLCFTPLSKLSKVVVPVAGTVCVLSITGVIVLPFLPWLIYAGLAAAVALAVYEFFHYRKRIQAKLDQELTDIGWTSSTSLTSSTPSVSTSSVVTAAAAVTPVMASSSSSSSTDSPGIVAKVEAEAKAAIAAVEAKL